MKNLKGSSFQLKEEIVIPHMETQLKKIWTRKLQLPFSVSYNYTVKQMPESRISKFTAICKYCDKNVSGSLSISSNFICHLRVNLKIFDLDFTQYKCKKIKFSIRNIPY